MKPNYVHLPNYNTPLTSQVNAISNSTDQLCTILSVPNPKNLPKPPTGGYNPLQPRVRFLLPPGHRERDSSLWRRRPRPPRQPHSPPKPATLTEAHTMVGVLNSSISSASWDTACTSHAVIISNPFISTGKKSSKIFALADGHLTPSKTVTKLKHNVREPSC